MAGIKNKIVQTYEECHRFTEEGELQKRCSIHNIYLPDKDPWLPCTDEYFYKSKNKTDNLGSWCKKCSIIKSTEFHANDENGKAKKKAERDLNKLYYKEHHAEWLLDHKDDQKEYQSGWRKDHPEKCREYTKMHRIHDITEAEWRSCLKVFENTCAYCGLPIEKHIAMRNDKYFIMKFHKEHVDDKGYNDLRNAVPSCQHCNSGKNISNMEEWYFKQKSFSMDRYIKILWWINEEYKEYIEDKPPYRIVKKKNDDNNKFHHELWTVDKFRNMIKCIHRGVNKKDVQKWVGMNPVELVIT